MPWQQHLIVFMMAIISLLLLVSLRPHLTFTAHVNVGIVNGTEAKPHSRPYMVSVQRLGWHICGGFLISDEFVLTAAHCWSGYPGLTVVVGAHDLRNMTYSYHVKVKSYIPHPGYKLCSDFMRNDIMLLRLQEKVKFNSYVKCISLSNECDVPGGTLCSVAGWGRLCMKGPRSNHLLEANMTTINHAECKREWESEYLASQMICAHGAGGSCKGDSGGPLVCGNTAVGITSFGSHERCNSLEQPNVYTKISAFLPWINQIANITPLGPYRCLDML